MNVAMKELKAYYTVHGVDRAQIRNRLRKLLIKNMAEKGILNTMQKYMK